MGHRPDVRSSARARPHTALSREELFARVWQRPLGEVAPGLGLSRTGLAKLCARLEVPCPPRGYWAQRRKGVASTPPPLPECGTDAARRRFERPDRQAQLLDVAAGIVSRDGVHAASLSRIARDAGVTEALAQTYFPRQADVLIALARQELATLRTAQAAEIARGASASERLARSTSAYLRHVEGRGALLQVLLGNPAVRRGLKAEREATRDTRVRAVADRFAHDSGVDPDLALCATAILTGVCLRAGRLLAAGRLDFADAEVFSQAMVRHGNRRLARVSGGRPAS